MIPLSTPWLTTLGLLAGAFTTIAFMPQATRIWRRRSAKDISLFGTSLFTVGITLWLLYGIELGALPIIIANAVTLALNLSILALKLRHG